MKVPKKAETNLQWHPAFYASIQIELQEEAENLIFENEHQLGTKPFGIDVLIIKKEHEKPIHKNIGRIFRKHNIIEYKSPSDYLSIDDFYKVYGYTCFYKADVEKADSIKISELTISLVCRKYPRILFHHLQNERHYEIHENGNGIYYINGDTIPLQIIVTKQLSKEENLWFRSLTDDLQETKDANELVQDYQNHHESNLYQSAMNIIIQANKEKFEEVKTMCEALKELFKDEMQEELDKIQEEWAIKRKEWDMKQKEAEKSAKKQINRLNKKLVQLGRMDDIIKAAEDNEYQERLIEELLTNDK